MFVVYSVSFAFTVTLFLAFMYRLSRSETKPLTPANIDEFKQDD